MNLQIKKYFDELFLILIIMIIFFVNYILKSPDFEMTIPQSKPISVSTTPTKVFINWPDDQTSKL